MPEIIITNSKDIEVLKNTYGSKIIKIGLATDLNLLLRSGGCIFDETEECFLHYTSHSIIKISLNAWIGAGLNHVK